MPSYNSTARMPFASGGKVGSKKPKVKRIILWKGKAKDWPGAKEAARQTRNRKAEGGRIELKRGGGVTGTKKKQSQEHKKKTPIRTFLKNTLEGKYMDPSRGTAEDPKWRRTKKAKGGKAKDSVHQPTTHSWWLLNRNKRDKKAKGGKADKNWIQGVNKSIKKRGTKGVCTGKKFGSASCKPGSKRYNLAKTFKKMARAKHASGGLVRYI